MLRATPSHGATTGTCNPAPTTVRCCLSAVRLRTFRVTAPERSSMTGRPNRPWHQGSYAVHARLVRETAALNPDTRCWRCGLTLDQIPPHSTGQPARWTAGHVNDAEVDGELQPECSPCADRTGAERGNQLRHPTRIAPWMH